YPALSINPGNPSFPTGGSQFYSTPLALHQARNVSLSYSVFFPRGFEWVRGGKLPGLYGGREGCSGGDEALDCFSTRMMWRAEGEGELYLYAPRSAQPPSLCSPPERYNTSCSSTYGLSIGRGNFKWEEGRWTEVRQVVSLNRVFPFDNSLTFDGFNFALQNPFSQDQTTSASLPPFGNASSPISTFFGGHDEEYATPREQHVWFKDFRI
ncbi:polysaccharide lyase family 14 protein, partial [Pterulicium gracile]